MPAAASVVPQGYQIKKVSLWVCPTPGCPDFYGDGRDVDLGTQLTGSKTENKHSEPIHRGPDGQDLPRGFKHTCAQCPTCRAAGRPPSERVLCTTTVLVPLLTAPEPAATT